MFVDDSGGTGVGGAQTTGVDFETSVQVLTTLVHQKTHTHVFRAKNSQKILFSNYIPILLINIQKQILWNTFLRNRHGIRALRTKNPPNLIFILCAKSCSYKY